MSIWTGAKARQVHIVTDVGYSVMLLTHGPYTECWVYDIFAACHDPGQLRLGAYRASSTCSIEITVNVGKCYCRKL